MIRRSKPLFILSPFPAVFEENISVFISFFGLSNLLQEQIKFA